MFEKLVEWCARRVGLMLAVALVIASLGVYSWKKSPIDAIPDLTDTQVIVWTEWMGRSPQLIEDQVNGIEGVANISSSSWDGSSRISVEFSLDRSLDEAANDIRDRISRITNRLPEDADPPQISKADSDARPILYLNFTSTTLDPMALTDYAERYIVDQLAVIPGVDEVSVSGSGRYSMRIWLDRTLLTHQKVSLLPSVSFWRKFRGFPTCFRVS